MTFTDHPDALAEGYRVQEYEFLSVLGVGGFGITYLARDTLLDRKVAIKEYLPRDFAVRTEDHSVRPRSSSESESYTWGLERFLDEARTLARLNHPSIIRIYKYFEAHGSGYIVMEYIDGETLSERLQRKNILNESQLMAILNPLIQGLEQVHAAGYLHRDITPKNVLLRKDGSPVLIDFGSARQVVGAHSRSVTTLVTSGYAPLEQYSTRGKQQGPWTDVYGLSAVAYRCITGTVPKDAIERTQGEALTPASQAARGQYTGGLLTVVDQGLAVKAEDRPQDLKVWKLLLMHGGILSDVETQSNFGDMYYMGYGVPRDYEEAVKWYQLIAEQGDARSQYNLGLMYANGYGVSRNYAKAANWLLRSAGLGYKKAVKWLWRLAAEQGIADAQYSLGRMYEKGGGVPQDSVEAVKWLQRGAEQGHAGAQCSLGRMYEKGGGVPQDGVEAVKWYRRAAEQGYAAARVNLGLIYFEGQSVPQDDAEAVKWFRRAGKQGGSMIIINLGWMYSNGRGIPQDDVKAIKCWQWAAYNRTAQYNLGVMYEMGSGVVIDHIEAHKWYRRAAEQGYAKAQFKLSVMYGRGDGVTQNRIEAHKWCSLAASRSPSDDSDLSDRAKEYCDQLAEQMTQEEVATAQRLAKEWQPKTWDQIKVD